MQDQRREARMMCADMVEVRWQDAQKGAQRALALLEDISPSGACLQLETAVPLGTEVHWDCPKQSFAGFVRYCVYREIGFFVGVEFSDACRWSKKAFKPLHLLDLERLVAKRKK
ncbi:MAG: PilZ domain-containing protein [Bryobacteraceae bacterium]